MERLVEIAEAYKVRTVIDATFATPINQQPLSYGIDYVVHSATKYLAGHHDLLAGVIISSKPRIDALREAQGVLGGILAPQNAVYIRFSKTG
jgi:cystathionine gamma-synthase